ncbi:lasso peptide biosynthesis PqqD family chaperone [Actinomadura macrotermitis]|uniref:Lasso peptide biosynthesis PqqD family chaperone n=1 Tax=Actinomadura macrotermitis TaxID=2585200 RepID=A0A7K0BQD1_9ACTN|nr:lasso peptide biosynthesis PqqD family chaperone [Actinomadura macrotermitis]MQY03226.1 hypothetical protein [Actinomadura macrotermitis]
MTLKLRDGVFTADTEYGIALLDEDHDQYWTLNPSAAIILRTLLNGGTDDDAVRSLTDEYAVDGASARQDVRDLVGELCAAGLAEEEGAGRRGPRRWRLGKAR